MLGCSQFLSEKKNRLVSVYHKVLLLMILFTAVSCVETNPNRDTYGEKVIAQNTAKSAGLTDFNSYTDSVYVPIYSDIYSRTKDSRFLLTATLSVRNTSYSDTLIVNKIDYFDTQGNVVEEYIDSPIYLKPMASIDYVIEETDKSGGSGANFIVIWSAKTNLVKPIIQAIMISTGGQQGVAFKTEGISIKKETHTSQSY